jgi:hypothetical protein
MIMALVMLGLVAVLLVVLARYFAYENIRTRGVTGDAQLSQLLLAGALDTEARAKSWDATPRTETWQLELPNLLSGNGAKVTLAAHPAEDGSSIVNIDAQFGLQKAAQTLRLRHESAGWTLASAEIPSAGT